MKDFMEIYAFDERIANENMSIVAAFEPEFKWSLLTNDDCGWINILMQNDTTFNSQQLPKESHSIVRLNFPKMTDKEIMEENESSVVVSRHDGRADSIDYEINAKIKKAIFSHITDFAGIGEDGELVRSNIYQSSTIYQIGQFLNHPSPGTLAVDLNICGVIGSVTAFEGTSMTGRVIVVYDVFEGHVAYYSSFSEFTDYIMGGNFIYAGQIVIDEPSKSLKQDASDYIKMVSVEVLS